MALCQPRARLIAADLDPHVVRYVTLRGVIPTATAGLPLSWRRSVPRRRRFC